MTLPTPGQLLPLARKLPIAPDPLALYAHLTNAAPDTILLESADIATRLSERSFLIPRAALRVTGRGRTIEAEALTANGRSLLPWLADRLRAGAEQVTVRADAVVATWPAPGAGDEEARLKAPSPVDALRALAFDLTPIARPAALNHLAAGVFAYDLLAAYEALPAPRADPLGTPDLAFWVPESLILIDHKQGSTTVLCNVFGGDGAEASFHDATARIEALAAACQAPLTPLDASLARTREPAEVEIDDAGFAAVVTRLKQRIVAGDVFQIVPSRTFSAPCPSPLQTYARLRALNPSPYMFYVAAPDWTLFGASPETAVKVDGGQVEISPIAGTARRGRRPDGSLDRDLDGRLEVELRLSEKELAEHMMLIDLARNDVARVSEPGTRYVSRLLTVDRYSHVMHLVSAVEGTLRQDLDALHAYVASMNMGTLVGAPKLKAAQILREEEPTRRGPYGGAVGYLAHGGDMDTAIVIRSAHVQDGTAYVRAGAGVVYDSDPVGEAVETSRKAAAVLKALGAERRIDADAERPR